MQVEYRLSCPRAGVHYHAVILQPGFARGVGDEGQHATRFLCGERAHIAEGIDMSLRKDEEVYVSNGVDVADRHEAPALCDVIAFSGKRAEETPIKLLWQGSPPV